MAQGAEVQVALTLSKVVQEVLQSLGQVEPDFLFTATGGSTTTFVNSNFDNLENQPEQDVFKNYLAIVVRDAGGTNAAPENEYGVVSAYNDAIWTGTLATLTTAIASGDTIMLAKQDKFPLQQIIYAINKGLQSLGDLPLNANTSLTTVANQTEYNIPVAVKRGLKQVWVQGILGDSNDNRWFQVHDKRNELTTGGTASILYIPQYPAGYTIRLIYDGEHPTLASYSDVISEYVHPEVVVACSIVKLLEWYNRQDSNQTTDSYYLGLQEQYRQEILPTALARYPIKKEGKGVRYFSLRGTERSFFPPLPFS